MNKDFDKISELYEKLQKEEINIVRILNKNMPSYLYSNGVVFEIQSESQFNKYDLILKIITSKRNRIFSFRIEYEIGYNQEEWESEFDNYLQYKWHRGLSLLTRKKYNKNFDLFIKSSKTFNSLFAIDVRNDFLKQFEKNKKKIKHNLGFNTNNEFFSINWKNVFNNKFSIKNGINKPIFLMENGNYKEFFQFLYIRFLKEFL